MIVLNPFYPMPTAFWRPATAWAAVKKKKRDNQLKYLIVKKSRKMGAQEGKLDFRGMLTSELGCHLQYSGCQLEYSGCQLELTYRVRRLQTTDEMGKMEMKAFGTC